MNLLRWLMGMSDDLKKEGDRLVDGVRRAADAFHAFADQAEELTLGRQEVPALEAPVKEVKSRKK
jgi:hypothetical protein